MTRRSVTFDVLRDHANEWVSGLSLVAAGSGYRYSARIDELRKAGHDIRSRRSKDSAVWEYMLCIEDLAPGQTELWSAA